MNAESPAAESTSHTPKRRAWLPVAMVVLGLVLGFVAGSITTGYVIYARVTHALQNPQQAPELLTERLDRRLNLTDTQKTRIQAIFHNRFKHLHQTAETAWPLVDQILDQIGEDVRYELDPHQQPQWDELYTTLREQWFKRPPPANQVWDKQ